MFLVDVKLFRTGEPYNCSTMIVNYVWKLKSLFVRLESLSLIIVIYSGNLLKALTLFFLGSHPMLLFTRFFKVINDLKLGSLKFEIFTWSKTCHSSAFLLLREIVSPFVISANVRMLNGCNNFIRFSYPFSNGPYFYSRYWIGNHEPVPS